MSDTATEAASAPLLAVFDLDGTITRHDSMTPFVFGYLLRRPHRLLRLPMALPAVLRFISNRDRGALKGALLRMAMGGVARREVDAWSERYVQRLVRRGLFAEALAAIDSHHSAGHYLVLMSASVDCYVPRVAQALGFHECLCSPVRWNVDNSLGGELSSANVRGDEKARLFRALLSRLKPLESVAYGNSTADLPHLRLATRGVYVNGSPAAIPSDARGISAVRWWRPATMPP